MRLNVNRIVVALAVVVLLGSGSALASPPNSATDMPEKGQVSMSLSGRASTLLAEIQMEATGLRRHAEALGTFARSTQYSWQSHANRLDGVKGHINAVGERTTELQGIRHAVRPWQQQAINEVTAHAAQVAASTQAAILQLNENRNSLYIPEYRDHLTTIADSSEDMKQAVDKFLEYDKTQQRLQRLQRELELTGD
jgi:signal transduction histidine kinase